MNCYAFMFTISIKNQRESTVVGVNGTQSLTAMSLVGMDTKKWFVAVHVLGLRMGGSHVKDQQGVSICATQATVHQQKKMVFL